MANMTAQPLTISFIQSGFDDYIASRVLFNKGYILRALMLASSSIERYLKVVPALQGKKLNIHLDRPGALRSYWEQSGLSWEKYFDLRFLDLLGKAYHLRYFDNVEQPFSIGFIKHQFLGTLDYTVHLFENGFIVKDTDPNARLKTSYDLAVEKKDPDLIVDNYLFEGISKKAFMEQTGEGFALYFTPGQPFHIVKVESKNMPPFAYEGLMTLIDVKPDVRISAVASSDI